MFDWLHQLAGENDAKVDPEAIGIPKINLDDAAMANAISAAFLFIGAMAVFFLLVGAVRYVTANGEQAKITQAKNAILYAIVGIVISVSGFAIVQFVIGRLTGTIQ